MSPPALEALHRCATEPTPERLDEAAGEVLAAWWGLDDQEDVAASTEQYGAIFGGMAALHPLAAVRLGMELRRRIYLQVPALVNLAGRRDGEKRAAREEESLLDALLIWFEGATGQAEGAP